MDPDKVNQRPCSQGQQRNILNTLSSVRSHGDLRQAVIRGQNATLNTTTSHSQPSSQSASEGRLQLLKASASVSSPMVLIGGPGASRCRQSRASGTAVELDAKVAVQLKDMGFSVGSIRNATQKCGSCPSLDNLLQELQASPAVQPPLETSPTASSSGSKSSHEVTVSDELERLGFSSRVIAATLARLGSRANTTDALNALCREPDSPLEQKDSWNCAICFEMQHVHGWQCPEEHRFCGSCMRQHVKVVAFPRCPQMKCVYELVVPDLRLLKVSRKRVEVFELNKLQDAIGTLGIDNSGGTCGEKVIHCKKDGCQNVVLVPHGGCRERFACPCGAPPFCTQCGEAPYHYHADCASVKALRQRWLGWVSEARDARKRQAEAHRALQERCQRDLALRQDEIWKTMNCRLCPHCQRTVEKLDGCNSMRCGSDFHGGGRQAGCGKEFDWDKAQPYVAQRVKTIKVTFEEANWVKGLFHPGVNCGVCNRDIFGPRLRCIHCEDFSVCAGCELHLDKHDLSHVFEIIVQADFDWGALLLPPGLIARISRSGNTRPPKWHGKQFEGAVCSIVGVAEGEPTCTAYEPGTMRSTSTHYKVKIKGHRGTDPEIPVEYLVPLFKSRFDAARLVEGRWNEPDPDPELNVPWIKF